VLGPERDTALGRAKGTYKKLFIDRGEIILSRPLDSVPTF
jgi:hypothetical protein